MRAFFDFITVIAYVGTVLGYGMEGRLSTEAAALLLILLVMLLAVGHALNTGLLGLILRVGSALGSMGALIFHYSGCDLKASLPAITSLLTLAVMLFGFYIMFRGVFPRQNAERGSTRPRVHQGIEIRYRRGW